MGKDTTNLIEIQHISYNNLCLPPYFLFYCCFSDIEKHNRQIQAAMGFFIWSLLTDFRTWEVPVHAALKYLLMYSSLGT